MKSTFPRKSPSISSEPNIRSIPPQPTTRAIPYQPTGRRIKVSLHQLINDLLTSLQPLARNRNNVLHNGVPRGLYFVAEENLLAFTLWNLLGNAVHDRQNANIHVITLVDDHKTTIAVKGDGTDLNFSICNSRLTF